ncbi:putative secreted protein with PEP-CTERM sorting signal [Nitrosospira sp. Nsp2]|uniref:HAF repeat-containing PEP-CTERM protein n=1 Tax=Nitrosospira sp. Nsp2 TaxID=136548 RepID=UPI000D2FAA6C|nr:HAF repeat-containing PEP-CTERM protein [Nitrosospira sp. Nsp2]PTR16062.1 putative secreted protein with PEP-CTERM sorting signal [Nitrosospira sp. Nsp2]
MKITPGFKVRGFILAAVFSAGVGFGTSALAQVQHAYLIDLNSKTATEFGALGDAPNSRGASAINDAGQVVGGFVADDGTRHAFITGPDGVGMRELGTLGGDYVAATGINDAGQVVGASSTAGGRTHAFITGPNGMGMRDLGTLDGTGSSIANGINDVGQVVGTSYTADGARHAFITGPDGMGMRDLGTLSGTSYSVPFGINNTGQVVGQSTIPEVAQHAFITGPDGTGMRDLGTGEAVGINETGQVVGYSYTADGSHHAFITGPDGMGMRDLGSFGGAGPYVSSALDINDAGQVVGYVSRENGLPYQQHAFITGSNGTGMIDLNSLIHLPKGAILFSAYDINNAGQVIAIGVIPEPEVYALFLAGLALVGFVARRKKMGGEAFRLG